MKHDTSCCQIRLSGETFISHKVLSLVLSCFPSQHVLDVKLSGLSITRMLVDPNERKEDITL